jgi:hypothetical protein
MLKTLKTMGKASKIPTKSHRNPTEIHWLHGKVMVRRGRLRDSVVVLGLAFTVRLSSGEDGYGVVEWRFGDGPVVLTFWFYFKDF